MLQEHFLLDGDLAARTRAAGPFRAAYLPPSGVDELVGVIAFPIQHNDFEHQLALAELHVVAMRLTLQVRYEGGIHNLIYVYD